MRLLILLLFCCVLLLQMHAQPTRPQYLFYHDQQLWLTYKLQYKTSDKWSFWFDINHRRENYINNHFQSLGRIGFNYFQSPSVTLSAGYAYMFPNQFNSSGINFENRLWQQIMSSSKNENRDIFFRFRLEQRKFNYNYFREDGIYIRPRMAFIWQKHLTKKIDFLFLEEIMFQFGYYLRNISPVVFEQNRILAGINLHFNEQINLDIAYMYVLQYRNIAWDYNSNHALIFTLNHNLSRKQTTTE